MTRENKLALIIGFTLVLVIGVLVSDHLSRARHAEIDTLPAAVSLRSPDPTVGDPIADNTRPSEAVPTEPAVDAAPPPVVIDQSLLTRAVRDSEPDEPSVPVVTTRAGAGARGEPTGRSAPAARPSEPGVVRHEVEAGESLFRIAERYLGDGDRWREIRDANRDVVGDDGSVRVGVVLVIPSGDRSARQQAARTGVRSVPAATSRERTYVVKPGDTLSEIAKALLGDGSKAAVERLLRANADVISDPDQIRVGMKLRVPA